MVNYQTIKLYQELIEIQQILNTEILPLAMQADMDEYDPKFIKSIEKFVRDVDRHLAQHSIEIRRVTTNIREINR